MYSNSYLPHVLIVPSGIETIQVRSQYQNHQVLIVPSGIETVFPLGFLLGCRVLIVPSGIETELHFENLSAAKRINCT